MKRLISSLSLSVTLFLSTTAPLLLISPHQARANEQLYYSFGDQKISLDVKTDSIAVALVPPRRGAISPMSRLQQDFGSDSIRVRRGSGSSKAATSIQAVDSQNYAILSSTQGATALTAQVKDKTYITEALPVLKIAGKSNSLILPNEIVIGFSSKLSKSEQEAILKKQSNIKSPKAVPFAPNFYSVIPSKAKGLEVLAVTNTLSQVKGVESAIPNFIEVKPAAAERINNGDFGNSSGGGEFKIQSQSQQVKQVTSSDIATLQWHINSQPLQKMMGLSGARTDVRAPEVWGQGKKGDGVIVAVIDNLFQWDHPALVGKIATTNCNREEQKQKEKRGIACLPGEDNGWDFSDSKSTGDKDTRVNASEVAQLQPKLIEGTATDEYLKQKYAVGIRNFQAKNPNVSESAILKALRAHLLDDPVASFHGTMSAGMIGGNGEKGFRGIAPNAKILPVRAGGLGRSLGTLSIVKSIYYSALRGADVVNMSFGSDVPNPAVAQAIKDVQESFPSIVFVASSGNETSFNVGYPSALPGVISVGAINLKGNRAPYSNFGKRLDVVAPGGDTSSGGEGGVLTLSGIGANSFWANSQLPSQPVSPFQDNRGYYVFTDGTSFSGPAVAAVVALMKSADPQRKLTAAQYRQILMNTSSREALSLIPGETAAFQKAGLTGSADEFFLGKGLVNAEKAVAEVERLTRQ
jgi:serine protease